MAIQDIASGISGFIGGFAQKLIFWKNWDKTSIYLLLALIFFLYFAYNLIRSALSTESRNSNRNLFKRKRY